MKDRSHHDFILHKDFEVLENLFKDYKIDVMVEAKEGKGCYKTIGGNS